jgi:transposase-like protein
MKDQQQSGVKPRRHDDTFKREAVRLWKSSGRSAETTARELGISVFQLYDWNRAGQPTRAAGVAAPAREQGGAASRER